MNKLLTTIIVTIILLLAGCGNDQETGNGSVEPNAPGSDEMTGMTASPDAGAAMQAMDMGNMDMPGMTMGSGEAGMDNVAPVNETRTSSQGHFQITVTPELEPLSINQMHQWTLHLESAAGVPVEGAEISVSGGMPAHAHGLPTAPRVTAYLGNGDYQVDGMNFQMPGHWQVTFDISSGGMTDSVRLDFMLQ